MYDGDRYPRSAIGHVSFLWKPLVSLWSDKKKNDRALWIWCHPSCYSEVWQAIKSSFYSQQNQNASDDSENSTQLLERTVPVEETEQTNSTLVVGNVEIQSLKNSIMRYKLTGPMSLTILRDCLRVADILPSEGSKDKWWHSYFEDQVASMCCTQQRECWEFSKKVPSPSNFPSNIIIGLTVSDPRLTRPERKALVQQGLL